MRRHSGKWVMVAAAAALTVGLGITGPGSRPAEPVEASSHREAPLITEDPTVDNTDLYAFVSPETGRGDYVTVIANYNPIIEPNQGPNYYRFSDSALYEIKTDTDGDAIADLTYQLKFQTRFGVITPNTFLYNTGLIGLPPTPSDPASPYQNLNVIQSYTLTEVVSRPGRPSTSTVLLRNARTAPHNIGPRSTGSESNYSALADAAVHTVATAGGLRSFVGVRDEGFYIDIAGGFDLLNLRNPGVDGLSGFNVLSIALEVPKARFANAGDTDGRIGVWATASRERIRVFESGGSDSGGGSGMDDGGGSGGTRPLGALTQVSRLGNPLINELLMPLRMKDRYNLTEPRNDATNIRNLIVNPGTSQGPAAFIPLLNGITTCTATTGRADLEAVLLLGIPGGLVGGFPGNRETQRANPVVSDLLRLNYNIAPAGAPNRLGLVAGDIAGFPNGRRVGDDVTDVALKATAGALQPLVGLPACAAAGGLSDSVDDNDVPFLNRFPYLALPHQGYNHQHDHEQDLCICVVRPSVSGDGFGAE